MASSSKGRVLTLKRARASISRTSGAKVYVTWRVDDACCVWRCALVVDTRHMSLTPHAATAEGRRHSAAVCQPEPIQAPEDDRLGRGEGRDMVHACVKCGCECDGKLGAVAARVTACDAEVQRINGCGWSFDC